MAEGITLQQLMMEIRNDLGELKTSFTDFKGRVVMKEELELWQEAQRTTRRWAVGTLIAIVGVAMASIAIVINL